MSNVFVSFMKSLKVLIVPLVLWSILGASLQLPNKLGNLKDQTCGGGKTTNAGIHKSSVNIWRENRLIDFNMQVEPFFKTQLNSYFK